MNTEHTFDVQSLRERMLLRLGPDAKAYPEYIEQNYPHILAKLVELWGRPEANSYLDSLMVMDRPGRQGFPADAASEIFRLSMIHGSLEQTLAEEELGWASSSNIEVSDYFGRRANR